MDLGNSEVFIHETAIVDVGATVGTGTKIWHFSHIHSGAQIGGNCTLGQNVYIASKVVVGNNCKIQNNVSLYDGVVLEDGVFCGPSCVFTNDYYPRAQSEQGWQISPTLVRQGASIGANATIVCGHTVGEYALIGAGAVVTTDVEAYALMVGVPARRIAWVCSCGEKLDATLTCRVCNRAFIDTSGTLRPL